MEADMPIASLLLPKFLGDVLNTLLEHIGVTVVVAVIILLIGFFRKRLIDFTSWFVAVKLHGLWDTTIQPDDDPKKAQANPNYKTEEEVHEVARLHQFFNKVWGETECKEDPEKSFKVRGQIVGEKLSLVYRATEGFYCGAILLQIKNTKLMRGFEIGRDRETGDIYTKSYTWHRRKGRLS
jgi:hypothetical protein